MILRVPHLSYRPGALWHAGRREEGSQASLPVYVGGGGGGGETGNDDVMRSVRERLLNFAPMPVSLD